jgi:hypothetical protein
MMFYFVFSCEAISNRLGKKVTDPSNSLATIRLHGTKHWSSRIFFFSLLCRMFMLICLFLIQIRIHLCDMIHSV